MDGFTYNNIFEMKGIEYLAIVAFFAILIPFWVILNKEVKVKSQVHKRVGGLSLNSLLIPQGLFFSRFHTWTHLEKSGVAKVGLDDLLVHITGEVSLNRLLDSGERIKKGDFLGEIVQKDKRLKIYSPISGEIVETNALLKKNPEFGWPTPNRIFWLKMRRYGQNRNWNDSKTFWHNRSENIHQKHQLLFCRMAASWLINRFRSCRMKCGRTFSRIF